jgi:hypothetical protein
MYRHYTDDMLLTYRYLSIEIGYCFGITESLGIPKFYAPTYMRLLIRIGLQQTQLAGSGDRFGSPLDLQLVKDDSGMSFDRAQGKEESFTDLTIRESLGNVTPSQERVPGQETGRIRSARNAG